MKVNAEARKAEAERATAELKAAQRAAGESAQIILTGARIRSGFAAAIPRETIISDMTSVLDVHRYEVTVRGYTIDQFEAILDAYLSGDDEAYDRQIESMCPKRGGFPD